MRDFYTEESYRQNQSLITKLNWQRGIHDHLRKVVIRKCARNKCKNNFSTIPSDPKKYCSHSCSAIVSNTIRILLNRVIKEKRFCVGCGDFLDQRHKIKYCSNKCQFLYRRKEWIDAWKNGEKNGSIGINTKNISGFLRHYLHEKFEHKCFVCGWNKTHPITGKVPLEIDHIDGNSENNTEENLRLLCPNCHALTPFFKNLNKGNGRKWRKDKYIKNS